MEKNLTSGSVWKNIVYFSLPYLLSENVYFLGYLVVSAIQMGATIDYAIVITSRYMDLKTYMPIKEAAIEALNRASGHVRTEVSKKMHIRKAPRFIFVEDDGAAYAAHINELLRSLNVSGEAEAQPEAGETEE